MVAAGMLIWGQTVLEARLRGWGFIAYWLVCLVFIGLAMLTALLDIRAVRRRIRDQQRDLIRSTLDEIESDAKQNESGSKQ